MSGGTGTYRLDGCVPEKRHVSAPRLKADPTGLPDTVDLRAMCTEVENQGTINACAANAVVGALECLKRQDGHAESDLSRLFVYYNARLLGECAGEDAGTCISHVMASVMAHGACEERLWPNDPDRVTARPPESCYENAAELQAVEFAVTPPGEPAMAALAKGLPIVFGTFMPDSYYAAAAATGETPLPSAEIGDPTSGHAMLIVGYDRQKQVWISRNSWGADWGDRGHMYIPFTTLQAYSMPEDHWVIGAITRSVGLSLSGPTLNDARQDIAANAPDQMRARLDALRADLRADISTRLDTARQGFRSRLRGED